MEFQLLIRYVYSRALKNLTLSHFILTQGTPKTFLGSDAQSPDNCTSQRKADVSKGFSHVTA